MKKIRVHCRDLVFDIETDEIVNAESKSRLKIGSSILHFSVEHPIYLINQISDEPETEVQEQSTKESPAPEGSILYLKERGHLV